MVDIQLFSLEVFPSFNLTGLMMDAGFFMTSGSQATWKSLQGQSDKRDWFSNFPCPSVPAGQRVGVKLVGAKR